MIWYDCVHGIELTLICGGHKAVISAIFWPTKISVGELLVIGTDWLGIK